MKIEVNGKTINQSTSVKYLRIVILNGKIISNKLPKEYQEVLVSFVKLGIMLMGWAWSHGKRLPHHPVGLLFRTFYPLHLLRPLFLSLSPPYNV